MTAQVEPLAPVRRIAAYAVVGRRGSDGDREEFLLVRNSDRSGTPGVWSLPGGGVDHGEHPNDTAILVVRCWVKSRNERNPHLQLPAVWPGTLKELPVTSRRKAGMTSSPHGLYVQGCTRATMAC